MKPEVGNKVHVIDSNEAMSAEGRYVRIDDYRDDEISLFDVAKVFIRQKHIFLAVFLLVSMAGVLYSYLKPEVFGYFLSIEIGRGVSGEGIPEDAAALLNKINRHYIPLVSNNFRQKYNNQKSIPDIEAIVAKNSNMVFLESKDVLENESTNFEFINTLVDLIVTDHQKISAVYRKELGLTINQIDNSIKRLIDENTMLVQKKNRLKNKQTYLKKRILMIEKSLTESEKTRQIAAKNTHTEGKAWALLTIDNDLRASRDRLATLEEQLNIGSIEESEKIDSQIAENIRAQSEQKGEMDKVQLKLGNLLETRALAEPMRTLGAVGKSKQAIVLIFLIIGFCSAIFAVFIAEFISKVREQA